MVMGDDFECMGSEDASRLLDDATIDYPGRCKRQMCGVLTLPPYLCVLQEGFCMLLMQTSLINLGMVLLLTHLWNCDCVCRWR